MTDSTKQGLHVLVAVVDLQQPDPEMIAAAWGAWHARHGGRLGPGPAFVESIKAANQVLLSRARASGVTVEVGSAHE
ncbi:hypothetical protein [Methylobacterium sp. Gmos1]